MHTRRSFLMTLTAASLAAPAFGETKKLGIKLGFDNYAIRSMGWKAAQLLDYASKLQCDTLFISDTDSYDSFEDAYLRDVKKKADDLGIALYAGGWSICPTSKVFRTNRGTAEEYLRLGLRLAKALGSPVFRCVLGTMEDRKTEGGIRARMADTIKVLKACKSQALDSGVQVSVENHAGDMHSWEARDLVEEAGKDFVGINIDSGNAAWTLEDPMDVLEVLGPYTNCSSLRDDMIWETPDGASVQWTAAGEGLIDWKAYCARWLQLCPKVPIMIESISGFAKNFPYKKEEFWKNYDKHPDALAHFEALAKKGHALPPFKNEGPDKKVAEQEYQKQQLEKSLKYLREEIGLGVRA